MSAASRLGARGEERAARALGTRRVRRRRGQSAPDVEVLRLPSGVRIQAEVKARARLPRLCVEALAQAERYAAGRAVPLVVLYQKGSGKGLAVLDVEVLAQLLGVDLSGLPEATPLRRERDPQLELLAVDASPAPAPTSTRGAP